MLESSWPRLLEDSHLYNCSRKNYIYILKKKKSNKSHKGSPRTHGRLLDTFLSMDDTERRHWCCLLVVMREYISAGHRRDTFSERLSETVVDSS